MAFIYPRPSTALTGYAYDLIANVRYCNSVAVVYARAARTRTTAPHGTSIAPDALRRQMGQKTKKSLSNI